MRTSQKAAGIITTIGIDIGKNTFHLVGLDKRGAIVLQQKVSRGQLERRLANIPHCHVVLVRRPRAAMRGLWPWIEQASKRLHQPGCARIPMMARSKCSTLEA